MKTTSISQMGGDLTAKHISVFVGLFNAAEESDFYLQKNDLIATVIDEVKDN